MSATGVSNLDHSIEKANAWLAEVAREFGTEDRPFAYRVTRAWMHALRDRLPVSVAAHLAAVVLHPAIRTALGAPKSCRRISARPAASRG